MERLGPHDVYRFGVSNVLNKTVATIISFFICISFARAADRSVVVGGVRIHISESGAGPTVVFESGMGEDTSTWNDVRPGIAGFAHTVAYDRPGLGQSKPTSLPRTVVQMAADLHAVLEEKGSPLLMCWWGIRSAERLSRSSRTVTRTRLQDWSWSIPRMDALLNCYIRGWVPRSGRPGRGRWMKPCRRCRHK